MGERHWSPVSPFAGTHFPPGNDFFLSQTIYLHITRILSKTIFLWKPLKSHRRSFQRSSRCHLEPGLLPCWYHQQRLCGTGCQLKKCHMIMTVMVVTILMLTLNSDCESCEEKEDCHQLVRSHSLKLSSALKFKEMLRLQKSSSCEINKVLE